MIMCSARSKKKAFAVATWLLAVAVFGIYQTAMTAAAADTPQAIAGRVDEQRLVGRWVRPDGGYILELKEIGKDGSVKAGYYNPKPINVFQAIWARDGATIKLFVELRDVNYPGSKYNLQYDPGTDRLIGFYFQAVQGQTYDVQFVRGK